MLTITKMVRLTIRATDDAVPPVLLRLMKGRFAVGASTVPVKKEAPTQREISELFKNIMVQ